MQKARRGGFRVRGRKLTAQEIINLHAQAGGPIRPLNTEELSWLQINKTLRVHCEDDDSGEDSDEDSSDDSDTTKLRIFTAREMLHLHNAMHKANPTVIRKLLAYEVMDLMDDGEYTTYLNRKRSHV